MKVKEKSTTKKSEAGVDGRKLRSARSSKQISDALKALIEHVSHDQDLSVEVATMIAERAVIGVVADYQ